MTGTLSVVGVGPGDPELLTIKALRILKNAKVICVPKGREEGSSLALSIVERAVSLKCKEIIEAYFPMRKTKRQKTNEHYSELDAQWNETARAILSKLEKGIDVVFLTLGDPTIYSTFFYLYSRILKLRPDLNIEMIPGVSSINAAASRAGISLGLGDDRIAVLPANYMDNLQITLETFNTVVLMKANKVFNEIVEILSKMNLLKNAICISMVGMEDEKIFRDITKIKQEELNYFSMVIVKK